MTGSAGPENTRTGFDLTFFNQTPCSHVVSKCNCTFNGNDFQPACFSKNSLASAGDGTGTSSPKNQPLDENHGSCPKECTGPSSSGTSQTVASCFEFYASSEEGINLFVDLNSSPSDWITQMRNEVSICQNICRSSPISQKECGQLEESHHQTINSFTRNLDSGQLKDFQEKACSFPNFMIKNKNDLQPDHPDGGNISLMTPAVKQHEETSELPEKLEGKSGLSSSSPPVIVQDKLVSVPPTSNENGCQITCSSRFSENSTNNTVVNTANCPSIPSKEKNQNSDLHIDSAVNHDSTLVNMHNTESASEVLPCFPPGSSTLVVDREVGVGSEIHPDSSSKSGNEDTFVSGRNPSVPKDALAYLNACQKQLPTSIKEQNSRSINGKEHLGCSQDCISDEKLDSVEVIQEPSKKRAHGDGGDQSDCNSSEDKILRSSKHPTGEVLRRRSMRLVPKILLLQSQVYHIYSCSSQRTVTIPKPT